MGVGGRGVGVGGTGVAVGDTGVGVGVGGTGVSVGVAGTDVGVGGSGVAVGVSAASGARVAVDVEIIATLSSFFLGVITATPEIQVHKNIKATTPTMMILTKVLCLLNQSIWPPFRFVVRSRNGRLTSA